MTAAPAVAAHLRLWAPGRRTLIVGLVATVTLVAFETLAVATIMPIVARELGEIHLYGWVFSAFFLGSLLGVVLVAGLIDRGGLVVPFLIALGLFSAGLVVAGLTPSMPILVGGRLLQGLGAGAIPPIAYVAIGRGLPEALRPRMFFVLSTAWIVPGVLGPALSGLIAEAWHWRVVFLGLLPLIAASGATALLSLQRLTAGPAAGDVGMPWRRRFFHALLIAAGAALAVGGLTSGSLLPGLPMVVAGVALALPPFRQLTPPGTLRAAAGLPAAVLLRGILAFAFLCADAYVPFALQEWRGTTAAVAGLALTAATLAWTAGAWVQSRWVNQVGARRLVRLGFGTLAVGVAGFALVLSPQVPLPVGIAAWAVAGLGMGFAYAPLSLTVLALAPSGGQGSATSALQLSDVLGTALGAGVGGALLAAALEAGLPAWIGLSAAFGVGLTVSLVGLAVAARLPGPGGTSPAAPPPTSPLDRR